MKKKLKSVLKKGKLNYIKSSSTPLNSKGKPALGWEKSNSYFGYSRDGGTIFVTGLNWKATQGMHDGGAIATSTGISDDANIIRLLLHEVLHKIRPHSKNHPGNFHTKVNEESDKFHTCGTQCF